METGAVQIIANNLSKVVDAVARRIGGARHGIGRDAAASVEEAEVAVAGPPSDDLPKVVDAKGKSRASQIAEGSKCSMRVEKIGDGRSSSQNLP